MQTSRIKRFLPNLSGTVARFPVPVLCALLAFAIANLDISFDILRSASSDRQVYPGLAAAFLSALAAVLFAGGRRWSKQAAFFLSLAAAAAAGLLYAWRDVLAVNDLFVFPGLFLMIMVAGYLRKPASQDSMWLFDAHMWLAGILAVIVTGVFIGGLAGSLASIDYLFGLNISSRLNQHILAAGLCVAGPLYGLSLLPDDLDARLDHDAMPPLLERGLSVLINYVLIPLVLVYVVILHIYAAKILFDMALPKGRIGWMVLLFGLGGSAGYVLAFPFADRGSRLLRWFMNWWFALTIVPVILLGLAIYRRISDYGVTTERYGVVLIAVWLAAMAVYLAVRRHSQDIRVIAASLALLLVAASFGPWGASGASFASQKARLMHILAQGGYLQNGKLKAIVPAVGALNQNQYKRARSVIAFFRREGALDRLKPLFAGRKDDPFKDPASTRYLMQTEINGVLNLNVDPVHAGRGRQFTFNTYDPAHISVPAGGVLSGPYIIHQRNSKKEKNTGGFSFYLDGAAFKLSRGRQTWRIDGKDILARAKSHEEGKALTRTPLRYVAVSAGGKKLDLLVTNITGWPKSGEIIYLDFWVLLANPG